MQAGASGVTPGDGCTLVIGPLPFRTDGGSWVWAKTGTAEKDPLSV